MRNETNTRPALLSERMATIAAYVNAQPGPVTPSQVAEALDLKPNGVGEYLKRLEARGLIRRPYRGLYAGVVS